MPTGSLYYGPHFILQYITLLCVLSLMLYFSLILYACLPKHEDSVLCFSVLFVSVHKYNHKTISNY